MKSMDNFDHTDKNIHNCFCNLIVYNDNVSQ